MPSEVVVELMRGVEEGVVFMGVAFRGLPVGRSRWRLPQSRDRALQGSTHYGYCVHGSHLLPMDHDRGNDRTPATRCAIGIKPVAVSLSNAPPTATPSSVMSPIPLWPARPTPTIRRSDAAGNQRYIDKVTLVLGVWLADLHGGSPARSGTYSSVVQPLVLTGYRILLNGRTMIKRSRTVGVHGSEREVDRWPV